MSDTEIDSELYYGLLWMKDNWIRNEWHEDGHMSKFYGPLERMITSNATTADLDLLIGWTVWRVEYQADMTAPPDVDNTGKWGPVIKVGEIHELLKEHKARAAKKRFEVENIPARRLLRLLGGRSPKSDQS